jgi:hypothetical protein
MRRVYVVELSDAAKPRDHKRFACLYVGSTAETSWQRFQNHKRRHKHARIVARHGCHLRPDLYEGLPTSADHAVIEERELEHAERLRDAGYTVYVNGSHGGWLSRRAASKLEPFTLEELTEEQLGHLDATILSVLANPWRPISASQCANVLWGTSGQRTREWNLTALPEYARFAHLNHGAIRDRVYHLQTMGHVAPCSDAPTPNALRPAPLANTLDDRKTGSATLGEDPH